METIRLDEATFAVVRNAVQMAIRETRSLHQQLDDEHVLHVHHDRTADAESTAEWRAHAAGTLRTYEQALHTLDHQHQHGPRNTARASVGSLVFVGEVTATIDVSGRSLIEAVDALHGMQAQTPDPALELVDGIAIRRLSVRRIKYLPDGGGAAVDVTGMQLPRQCPTCGHVYDHAGRFSRCPNCV